MYQLFCDGALLYDLRNPDYALADLQCEFEVNKTGSLSFSIAPTHPMYSAIQKMKSEIALYQDGEWLGSFRALNMEGDFQNIMTVTCEGELAFLLDSIQRPAEYHNTPVAEYFGILISNHNSDVGEDKQFTVGTVNVTDPNDSLYRYSSYESTWSTIEEKLLDRLGGYIRTRRVDGARVIDYVTDYANVNTQVIQFGSNILDLTQAIRGEDIATVLIPLGAKNEETDERLTVEAVNDGKDYIEDADAVALFGRIVKTVEFDDVTVASNLLSKGYEQLASQQLPTVTLTLSAIDLHLVDVSIERIKVGDSIRVISEPHGLDEYMTVQKLELDLQKPESSKVTLGTTRKTLSQTVNEGQRETLDDILGTQQYLRETISSVKVEVQDNYSEISKTAEEIKASVAENYLSKTDMETIQRDFQTTITQNSTEIRMDFTAVTNDIIDTISSNQSLLEEYIRFRGALIELWRVGNAFTAELSNEELAFKENGQTIAYISNQSLVITNAEIRNKLSLGNEERGWFDFIPRTTGNLSIQWRDAVT